MNKKRSRYILPLFILILNFYACKKDDSVEKRLVGTWELSKITFLKTNVSYPLDSFRNLVNVNLTLNSDFSVNETEDFGRFSFGPLGTGVIEEYTNPRNNKAQYLIQREYEKYNYSKFAISGDSLSFYFKHQYGNSLLEERHNRKFVLKSNKELDIERRDLLIINKNIPSTGFHEVKLSYRKR